VCTSYECYSYFVFQAEDGIRDFHVTGVQTCALPIFHLENLSAVKKLRKVPRICADNVNSCEPERIRSGARCAHPTGGDSFFLARSEERRVGKGGTSPRRQERRYKKVDSTSVV